MTGVFVMISVLLLLQCVSNHSSNWGGETERGGGGGTKPGRAGRMASQSVFSQLGVGGGGLKRGESNVTTVGTWSEHVEGNGVSHEEKAGIRRLLAKARSRTEGLDAELKGKYV